MDAEVWKVIVDAPWYSVSNLGRVKNRERDSILALTVSPRGYTTAYVNHHNRPVHQLVLEAFTDLEVHGHHIRHIDGDLTNNRLDNLELMTRKPRVPRGGRQGRPPTRVLIVETGDIYESQTATAEALGVRVSHINNCLRGRTKRCRGYTLEYVD